MARRTYGTGSLREINGRWVGKWWANGVQVKRTIGRVRTPGEADGLTKLQAEKRLRELMEADQVVRSIDGRKGLRDAAAAFLGHLNATGAKRSTQRAYRAALDGWWTPTFDDRSLDRITPADIEDVMSRMRGEGLSDKTILNYVGVLRALFNWAMAKPQRWCATNPVEDVKLPRKPVYAGIKYLTVDEIRLLAEKAPTPLDRALYLTAGMTGMRIGELQALQWGNVDFKHGRIRVAATWDAKDKTTGTTKTLKSSRAVPMVDEVARELLNLTADLEPDPAAFVFGDPDTGQPLHWRPLYGHLRDAQEKAGVDPSFGFHAMRHGYGTALAAKGVPLRTIMEWMGHTNLKTTQIYADYAPNRHERDVVTAAFAGTNSGTNLSESEVISEHLTDPEVA